MNASTIRASRSSVLRLAWLVALVAAVMVMLMSLERTGASSPAAAADLPIELAGTFSSNVGTASNTSDGTAVIRTGDATAVGTISETTIFQRADADSLRGIAIINQSATVITSGTAVANTGGNTAIGNASQNFASNTQSSDSD